MKCTWGNANGIASVARLELERIGWAWPVAFVFRDEKGNDIDLRMTGLELAAQHLKEGYARALERRVFEKAWRGHRAGEQRVSLQLVQRFLRSRAARPETGGDPPMPWRRTGCGQGPG